MRKALLFVFAGITALALLVGYWITPQEPVHNGRNLSSWLRDLENGDSKVRDPAVAAVRAMGTNALPSLFKMLCYRNSALEKQLLRLTRGWKAFRLPILVEEDCRERAAHGFLVLGSAAKPAVPALVQALNNGDTTRYSAWVLNRIEDDAGRFMLQALTNEDARVRAATFTILQQHLFHFGFGDIVRSRFADATIRVHPFVNFTFEVPYRFTDVNGNTSAIPKLINDLDSTELPPRIFAAQVLGQFGIQASNSIPALRKAAHDSNAVLRETASNAVRQILTESGAR